MEKELIKELSNGWFFNPRTRGIRRVRTLTKRWLDEHTEEKRLRHLFSRKVKFRFPSPRYFAIKLGSLGWWTTENLFKAYINDYKEKLEEVRADFLAGLRDPFFLARFREIANAFGYSPAELLESISFTLPYRKIILVEYDDSQAREIVEHYKRDIDQRILEIVKLTRELLTKGIHGRKFRVEKLAKMGTVLEELNIAKYHQALASDCLKAYSSIANLDRKSFPKTLENHLNDATIPKPIKTELKKLVEDAQNPVYWSLK